MPALHHIEDQSKLIVTTWEGDVSESKLIAAIENYQATIKGKSEYHSYNEIIDFSKSINIDLSAAGVQNIVKTVSKTDDESINSKVAIIVSSNLAFGLARVYGAYRGFSNKSNKDIRVFREKCDALEWIGYR